MFSYQLIIIGRYQLLNAFVNYLRWPNLHTIYFANLLMRVFENASLPNMLVSPDVQYLIREQIVRVLIERMSTLGPYPWGLVFLVSQLMRGERFRFWDQPFTRISPEIARRLHEVADFVRARPEVRADFGEERHQNSRHSSMR